MALFALQLFFGGGGGGHAPTPVSCLEKSYFFTKSQWKHWLIVPRAFILFKDFPIYSLVLGQRWDNPMILLYSHAGIPTCMEIGGREQILQETDELKISAHLLWAISNIFLICSEVSEVDYVILDSEKYNKMSTFCAHCPAK